MPSPTSLRRTARPGALKVCFVAPDLGYGGAQKQLVELVAGLPVAEFDVVVINLYAAYTSETLKARGVRIVDLEYRGGRDFTKIARIRRIIARERPDVLHCLLTSANFYGLLASVGTGVPVRIAGERSLGNNLTGLRAVAYPRILSLADTIVTNSRRNKAWLEQTYGRAPAAVTVIHNGCALPPASSPDLIERQRQRYGIEPAEPVVATLTHLTPEKDVECLVRAAARLAAAGVRFRLVIAGDGPRLGAVQALVAAHRLEPRVVLAGHVSHPDALLIAQLCDVFALTSKIEGMPNALMEAMSFARACVASNVGGMPELIEDGVTGLQFESGDDEALAARLATLLADAALRRRLGQHARTRIADEFSVARMVRSHAELYRSLAARQAGGRLEARLAG